MRSFPHFLISVSLGGILAILLRSSVPSSVLVVYAGILDVAIDLVHFSIARWNAGNWAALRGVLVHPHVVLLDQDVIFEKHHVWPLQRLLTHLVFGSVSSLCCSAYRVQQRSFPQLWCMYILTDLVHDNLRHDQYLREVARYLAERD